jgi:hypothetical protein
MEIIILKYQVSLFGSFDEIIPNGENIKFFLDEFSDKNLIPNQFKEISLDLTGESIKNNNFSRLSLTNSDMTWNVKFSTDRIDFIFSNSDINVIKMPDIKDYISNVKEFIQRINKKYNKTFKRLGLVSQYLVKDIDINESSNKFNTKIGFFNKKPLIEWTNKNATRQNLKDELINISSELRWIKTNLKIDSRPSIFEGIVMNFDTNTIAENNNYRFNTENTLTFLDEILKIENELYHDYKTIIK